MEIQPISPSSGTLFCWHCACVLPTRSVLSEFFLYLFGKNIVFLSKYSLLQNHWSECDLGVTTFTFSVLFWHKGWGKTIDATIFQQKNAKAQDSWLPDGWRFGDDILTRRCEQRIPPYYLLLRKFNKKKVFLGTTCKTESPYCFACAPPKRRGPWRGRKLPYLEDP